MFLIIVEMLCTHFSQAIRTCSVCCVSFYTVVFIFLTIFNQRRAARQAETEQHRRLLMEDVASRPEWATDQ